MLYELSICLQGQIRDVFMARGKVPFNRKYHCLFISLSEGDLQMFFNVDDYIGEKEC